MMKTDDLLPKEKKIIVKVFPNIPFKHVTKIQKQLKHQKSDFSNPTGRQAPKKQDLCLLTHWCVFIL